MVSFVDLGSTHIFIDSKLVSLMGLNSTNFQISKLQLQMTLMECVGVVETLNVMAKAFWKFHLNLDGLYMKFEKGQLLIKFRASWPNAKNMISANKMIEQLVEVELCFVLLIDGFLNILR